jgi:hypothetical protein
MPKKKLSEQPEPRPEGRPTKYNNEMYLAAREYIIQCDDQYFGDADGGSFSKVQITVNLPTIEGLASHLKVNRDTLYTWSKEYSEFSDILEELKELQAQRLINNGLSGHYNSTIAKLLLSKHGYAEKSEIDHNNPDGNLKTIIINKNGSSNKPPTEADGGVGSV